MGNHPGLPGLPREEICAQTRPSHRSEIKKLEQLDVSVIIDKHLMLMSKFHTAYLESIKRVDADNYYNFPMEYFTELRVCSKSPMLWSVSVVACTEIDPGTSPRSADGASTESC